MRVHVLRLRLTLEAARDTRERHTSDAGFLRFWVANIRRIAARNAWDRDTGDAPFGLLVAKQRLGCRFR